MSIQNCKRPDLSTFLIHLTKADNDEIAFGNLKSIIRQRSILQSLYKLGSENVVCFTETPIGCIKTAGGLRNYTNFSNYSTFGLMVYKKDVYETGGRPVLYLEDKFQSQLPKEIQWRHQKFEPSFSEIKYDWTWEREWRCKGNFNLHGLYYEAIVPSISYADRLKNDLDAEQILIYEDCNNSKIHTMNFDEICDSTYEQSMQDPCIPPEIFEKSIICLDGTC